MINISPLAEFQSLANTSGHHSGPMSAAISASPPAGVLFDHVVVIMMENEGVGEICGNQIPPCVSSAAPYLAGLANNYTLLTQYISLIPTSQPNYVALISGSMLGCSFSGCPFRSGVGRGSTAPNLVDRFEAAGLTWRGYFENMTAGAGCAAAVQSPEPYVMIHNPFAWFQDITNNTARCNRIVNANPNTCTVIDCTLINDLNNSTSSAPNFMWLTPNDCHDMRGWSGCGTTAHISPGDAYLSRLVPNILESLTFTTTRSALFIVFDEGHGFCPATAGGYYPNGTQEDCVFASWIGPTVKTSYASSHIYTQYSFPNTVELNWNLASFTVNDTNAVSMTEFFQNTTADFTIQRNPTFVLNSGVCSCINPNQPVVVSGTTNATILLTSTNNFAGTVTLTGTSNPIGPSITFNPSSLGLNAGGTATSLLTFIPSANGNYTITVKASNGTISHTTTVAVGVISLPSFTLTISQPALLDAGQSSLLNITVAALNGFTGKVTISDQVPVVLICGNISPANVTGSGTASVSCSTGIAGNYMLTVTGTSGSLTNNASVILGFQDFGLTAPSQIFTIFTSPNSIFTFNITATSLNNFLGQISFNDSMPPGLNCEPITPSSITGSGTVSVSCNSPTAASYTLIINGTSSPLVHTVVVQITVQSTAVGGQGNFLFV